MDRKTIGFAALVAGALGLGIAFLPSSSGVGADGGPPFGPPVFNPDAAVQHAVAGIHATVAQQCQTTIGLVCDFINVLGVRVVIQGVDGGVVPYGDGGAQMVVVQAPDGGWVLQ